MGIFSALRRSRSGSFRGGDGSSRRGRRFGSGRSGQDDPSGKGDSSTHSALFDLELSSRGRGAAAELLARLNGSVHDEGSAHGGAGSGDPSVRLPSGLLQRIIYLGRPVMEFELDLLQDVRALRANCQVQPDGQLDLEALVDQLHDLGYACYLKHNNPADPGHRHNIQPSCLEKLRHEFIVVAGRADGSLSHWCLVDPRFREQFAIAQPTPAYDRLLKAAPVEFVGTPLRLQALVETLCGEMAEAFVSQGLTLPPWRRFHALLSKWFDPEEMPAVAAPPPPPHTPQLPPPAAHLPLQAAPSAAPAPFQTAQPQAAAPAGVGLQLQQPAPAAARPAPSLLQQQAAAALAERQTSAGGSQDFYEALEMHRQSMRLQQQAAAGAQQWQSPTRPPLPPGHPQEPQQQAQPEQQQPQQQGAAPAALSRENLRQLDAAYSTRAAAQPGGTAGAGGGAGRQPGERSSKPRRRRPPPAGLALASGSHHAIQAALWDEEEGGLGMAAPALGGGGLSGAHVAQAQLQLHGSGSWSELSTILEGRSNASSPAAAVLLAAGHAQQLGTSCASRRSAGSAFAAVAMASVGAGAGLAPPQRSPARGDQQHAAPSAAGAEAAARQLAAAAAPPPHPSLGASLVGFAAPPLGRASLAKSLAKSSAAASSAQPPSTASSGSGSSPLAPLGATLPHAAAGGPCEAGAAAGEGSGRGRRKVVSLLAKGLKSVGQKQTWAGLLPGVNTVRRVGPNGPAPPQRNWSWRGTSEDGSSRRGRKAAQAAQAAAAAAQQPSAQQLPVSRHL